MVAVSRHFLPGFMFAQIIEFSSNHPILSLSFVALVGLILFIEIRNFTQEFTSVGASAAINVINNEDPVVLDVRENNEISDGMLNNAIHIPLSRLNDRVTELDKYKDGPVLVYCRSGNRSGGVCRTLTGRGFDKVYNLSGGVLSWKEAHLPLQTGKKEKKEKGKKKKK